MGMTPAQLRTGGACERAYARSNPSPQPARITQAADESARPIEAATLS